MPATEPLRSAVFDLDDVLTRARESQATLMKLGGHIADPALKDVVLRVTVDLDMELVETRKLYDVIWGAVIGDPAA